MNLLPWLQIYSCLVMMSLSNDKQADVIGAFNTTSRYVDDILNINNVTDFNTRNKLLTQKI